MTDEGMNYYIILDIDPSVDDWGVIEKRLDEKKKKWGTDVITGKPADRRKSELYLKNYNVMVTTLKNPETRREMAKDAQRRRDEEKRAKYKDLDDAIAILSTKGGYTVKDVEDLYISLKEFFTKEEIKKRIIEAGIPEIIPDNPTPKPPKPILPLEDRSAIKRDLEILKKDNLYDFLNESPKALYSILRNKADEGNREELRIGKADPISNAKKSLYGFCLKIFKSQDDKNKYDNTLVIDKMDSLKIQIDTANKDGSISVEALDLLIKQAREKGVSTDDAKDCIEEYARSKGWIIQRTVTGKLPSQDLLQCGHCFTVAKDRNATHCGKCGKELITECPNCHKKTPTQDMACIHCGFNSGYSPIVKGLLDQGKKYMIEGDYPQAIQCFDLGLLYWTDWQPLLDAKTEIDRRQKDRDTKLDNIRKIVATTELMKARIELEKFQREYPNVDVNTIKKQIDDCIEKAESFFAQGEAFRLSGKIDEALDKYQEGLRYSQDHGKIKTAIAACPPSPPDGLTVVPFGDGFRLNLTVKSQRSDIEYLILRKANSFPTSGSDGISLGRIKNTTFDDNNPKKNPPDIGIPWYYAVYTSRAGALSSKSAQSGPHIIIGDVKNGDAVPSDSSVSLSWEPIAQSKGIEVWRKIGGIPSRRGDGMKLTPSGNSLQDSGLKNGTAYGYLIISIFSDPVKPGEVIPSKGAQCIVTPVAPPKPVMDLKCENNKDMAILTWTPIPGASVQIRKCDKLPDYTPGFLTSMQKISQFGELVPTTTDRSAQIALSKQGRSYFIPITYILDTAVVGKHAFLTTVDAIIGLKYRKSEKTAIFTWEWPAGINEALIRYRSEKFIKSPTDTFGAKDRVTKENYVDKGNFWQVVVDEKRKYFFTIFTKATDIDAYSQGVEAIINFGDAIRANYKLVQKKGLLSRSIKEAYIEVECDKIERIEDKICIIGKKRITPVSIGDGVLVGEINLVKFDNGKAQIPIDEKHIGKDLYLKLFFNDSKVSEEIRLIPASKDELKLE